MLVAVSVELLKGCLACKLDTALHDFSDTSAHVEWIDSLVQFRHSGRT